VIHTVGPRNGSTEALQSCYEKSLSYHREYGIRSIAFPCIATGAYGFSNQTAAHIALRTVRKFLEANMDMKRIIFCVFQPLDVYIYQTLIQMYFPIHDSRDSDLATKIGQRMFHIPQIKAIPGMAVYHRMLVKVNRDLQ
jgi:hypothetical protein